MEILSIYLQLRLKQLARLLVGVGLLRSLLLFGATVFTFYLLVKTENRWIAPIMAIVGLMFYHNERRDKAFLLLQTQSATTLFRIEYLLIGLPFILIEALKGHFLEASAVVVTALLLPQLKSVRWKTPTFPLPFLYKGGLEYLRMFRLYGWIYLVLLLLTFLGALHGNVQVGKVALIGWGVIQSMAYSLVSQRQMLANFLNYATFQKHLLRSVLWNVAVTCIPLIAIVLCFSFDWGSVLFSLSAMLGCLLYLWNMGMLRFQLSSSVAIAFYQLFVLIPLFFFSCFVPFLLIPFVLINGVCYLILKNTTRQLWN